MWTGAYSGLLPHLKDRASFVVVSPDPPEVQKKVIQERGYNFSMYSAYGTSFIQDMGFYDEKNGYYMPEFSIFVKDEQGKMKRTAKDFFGPYDPYNPAWHMFALLPKGVNKWTPKIEY